MTAWKASEIRVLPENEKKSENYMDVLNKRASKEIAKNSSRGCLIDLLKCSMCHATQVHYRSYWG